MTDKCLILICWLFQIKFQKTLDKKLDNNDKEKIIFDISGISGITDSWPLDCDGIKKHIYMTWNKVEVKQVEPYDFCNTDGIQSLK